MLSVCWSALTSRCRCNLHRPFSHRTGTGLRPRRRARREAGAAIERAELVGLVPMQVLVDSPVHRLTELGLDEEHTIEAHVGEPLAF